MSISLTPLEDKIIVKQAAGVRYTPIQNWSNNVYNLVTKRPTVAAC